MYSQSCSVYDAIHRAKGKDYQKETELLRSIVRKFLASPDRTLLDVACGTGQHLRHLRHYFDVTGLDASPEMVARAREANPGVPIHCMARHLPAKGLLVLEPWLFPESIRPGSLHAALVDEKDLKVARMSVVKIDGRTWSETDHFLVMTKGCVRHFREKLTMGIFDRQQYQRALEASVLEVHFDETGLTGRGLFIGVKQVGDEKVW